MRTGLPVRSALLKHCTGGLVVRWVTTSEYLLLIVFLPFFKTGVSDSLMYVYAGCYDQLTWRDIALRIASSSDDSFQGLGFFCRFTSHDELETDTVYPVIHNRTTQERIITTDIYKRHNKSKFPSQSLSSTSI